jgi:hypothetical protein
LVFTSGHFDTLTLRTVFRLGLRQTEGLIGSIIRLLGVNLPTPDGLDVGVGALDLCRGGRLVFPFWF